MADPRPRKSLAAKKCPICGRPPDPKYAPFCSRRCADVDLYRWLSGAYVIPGAEPPHPSPSEEKE